jgi:hypothetical protein
MKKELSQQQKDLLKKIIKSKKGYVADFAERGKIVIFDVGFNYFVDIPKVSPWVGSSAESTVSQSITSALGYTNLTIPRPRRCVKRID